MANRAATRANAIATVAVAIVAVTKARTVTAATISRVIRAMNRKAAPRITVAATKRVASNVWKAVVVAAAGVVEVVAIAIAMTAADHAPKVSRVAARSDRARGLNLAPCAVRRASQRRPFCSSRTGAFFCSFQPCAHGVD